MLKPLLIALAFNALTSCGPTTPIAPVQTEIVSPEAQPFVGRWVEVLLGSDGDRFTFNADGTVESASDNGQTYQTWRVDGDMLYLTSGATTSVFTVETITADRMGIIPEGDSWPLIFRAD